MSWRLQSVPMVAGIIYILISATQHSVASVGMSRDNTDYQRLIEWVELHSNTHFERAPLIVLVPTERFKNIVNAEKEYGREIDAAEAKGQILLDDRFADMTNPVNAALIVHELTHYKQEIMGQRFDCTEQREAEAFNNQNVFLSEYQLPPALPHDLIQAMDNCSNQGS